MRTIDNAVVSVEAAATTKRMLIEAPTGEMFLVELSPEKASDLAAALTAPAPEPAPIDPPADPAPELTAPPAPAPTSTEPTI